MAFKYQFLWIAFFALLFLLIYIISAIRAIRDRREIKARIKARRAGLDPAQQDKQPGKSPRSRRIVIIHDGAREERIKMGQYNSMKRRITFTRENVAFMIHTIPGSNVDPRTGQEQPEYSDLHQTSVSSDSSGTSSGDAAPLPNGPGTENKNNEAATCQRDT